jgi:hypothetical protein
MNKKHILYMAATTVLLSAGLAFGTTYYDSVILGDNPVSYWPLQETNGPTIHDIVGTNNGTMMVATDAASPTSTDTHQVFAVNSGSAFGMAQTGFFTNPFNVPDSCLFFTNTNTCEIVVPYSPTLDQLTYSAEAWIYPVELAPYTFPPYPEVDMVPLGFEWNTGAQFGWWWDMNDGKSGTHPGQFSFEQGKFTVSGTSPTGWQNFSGPANNNNNTNWVYVTMTYDGNNLIGYYNGAQVGILSGATYQKIANKSTACPLVMGSIFVSTAPNVRGRFFNGAMEHVAVYNYALTAGQVLNHYNAGVLGPTPPIIGTEPVGFTNFVGYTNSLSVAASGTAPLSYQWYDGVSMLTGATNPTLVLTNLQLTNAGSYTVTVTNLAGSTNSSNAVVAVLSLPTNVYDAAVISEFPNAYYPLNETNGTVANDLIQAGIADQNEAAYVAAPLLDQTGASSTLGPSVTLDGLTQGVVVTNSSAMNIIGATTMEAWVQITDTNYDQEIVGHGPNPNDTNPSQVANVMGITVDYNASNNPASNGYYFIQRYSETATPTNIGAYCPIPSADLPTDDGAPGPWVYLVATADGNAWNLFRNGVLAATFPDTVGAGPANGGWAFGARNDSLLVMAPFFWGSMQHVAIYNYALSPATIQHHYQLGLTGTYTAPLAPTVSIQQSGGNVTMTWTGGSLVTAASVNGPWTFVTNPDSSVVTSPYTVGATNTVQFFQASLQAP